MIFWGMGIRSTCTARTTRAASSRSRSRPVKSAGRAPACIRCGAEQRAGRVDSGLIPMFYPTTSG